MTARSKGARVLVVENDLMSRELAKRVLTAGGYDVLCAEDGQKGLAAVERFRPDLVLVDLHMPGLDGIEVSERLRGRRDTAQVPIAVLSAQAFPADLERAKNAGCSAYLTKPIGARELLDRVGELIEAQPPKNGKAAPAKRGAGARPAAKAARAAKPASRKPASKRAPRGSGRKR